MNYDKLLWQQRELEKAVAAIRPALALREMLPRSFKSQRRDLERLTERFTLPARYLTISDEIQRAIGATQTSEAFRELASHNLGVTTAFTELQSSMAQMAAKLSRPTAEVTLVAQAMTESLVPTEALLRLGQMTPPLMDISLRPQIAFKDFAFARVAAADAASEIYRANTLSTIAAASELLTQMARGPELASLMAPPQVEILPLPEVNAFTSLENGLASVDLDAEDTDVEAVVATSASGATVKSGGRIVELVYNLNVEAERKGADPIFKPTSKTMRAFHVVPSRVAYDEESFFEVVDHLFFLLYEGSGNAKRLTDRISTERLEALWRLKHLRLASRHDIDHGNETNARKKAIRIGDTFRALIGRANPRSREEWSRAQAELYRELVVMLEEL